MAASGQAGGDFGAGGHRLGGYVQISVSSPNGDKHPLKVKLSDDVATLRAVITQMYDTGDWTQISDRREDRKEYSDFLDEDTGFSEVIALQANPQSQTQGLMDRFSGRPRSWLEWSDKRGKLRLMCGAYIMEDGKTLEYYHVDEGSVVHPLYERYGDTLDASAAMLVDPTWYKEQYNQAKKLANEVSSYDWRGAQDRALEYGAKAKEYLPTFQAPSFQAPSFSLFSDVNAPATQPPPHATAERRHDDL
mmetsp:Transcript_33780/g.69766  ORF Transcript_33780/g.69766 Transcript_33780/m.69766 type:complete len:248 (+) Transcript_33780:244-987(+)